MVLRPARPGRRVGFDMDVRCDRCQTEYELDDASVGEAGASVQCTSCGHTFVVAPAASDRATPTVSPAAALAAAAGGSSWMLTTEEGKTHRFRDPTTLQKWIVERRVGRADRVCPPGGSWRRLGDVDELRPFFEVVDQADRAAAAARVVRPTAPETPQRKTPRRNYASPDVDDDDILANEGRGGARGPVDRFDSDMGGGLAAMGVDDSLDVVLPRRHTGRNLVLGALIVGLAGGAAYLGFKDSRGSGRGATPAGSPPIAATPAATPPAPGPAATPPATPPSAPTTAAPPRPAAPAPVAAAPAARPAGTPPDEPAPVAPSGESARASARPGSAEAPARSRSYEQLVAEGDRALENGSTGRAQKLYDDALKLQPNGVAAMTGTAYVLLDKQKPLAAIDMFKRALSSSPGFPQALFGLGEAYRSQGSPVQAVEAYRRYLEAAPGGSDAPAARRQLRELESLAASRRQEAAPPSTEPPPAPTGTAP
jgi:predicted Zn finger-like uncharacterized protein